MSFLFYISFNLIFLCMQSGNVLLKQLIFMCWLNELRVSCWVYFFLFLCRSFFVIKYRFQSRGCDLILNCCKIKKLSLSAPDKKAYQPLNFLTFFILTAQIKLKLVLSRKNIFKTSFSEFLGNWRSTRVLTISSKRFKLLK